MGGEAGRLPLRVELGQRRAGEGGDGGGKESVCLPRVDRPAGDASVAACGEHRRQRQRVRQRPTMKSTGWERTRSRTSEFVHHFKLRSDYCRPVIGRYSFFFNTSHFFHEVVYIRSYHPLSYIVIKHNKAIQIHDQEYLRSFHTGTISPNLFLTNTLDSSANRMRSLYILAVQSPHFE